MYAFSYLIELTSNMLSITFATRIDSVTDPLVKRSLQLGNEFMDLTGDVADSRTYLSDSEGDLGPWSNAIDFIEPLQWIPTKTRSRGRKLHQEFIEVYGDMVLSVKSRMEAGENFKDCLVKSLLEYPESEKLSWTDMCMLTTSFASGG